MRKISYWAKDHPGSARIIIICSFILLTLLGMATGNLLRGLDIGLSSYLLPGFISIYLLAVFAYPSKALKRKWTAAVFYTRQKTCDFLLAASTFCMIVFFSNQPGRLFDNTVPVQASAPFSLPVPKDSVAKYKTIAAFSMSMKDETGKKLKWKERKKLLREQIRAIKRSDQSKGGKAALIILAVLVALGLLGLVGALACNLSCGGSEGAAILVLLAGSALVIFLLVLVIRGIKGKKRKPKNKEAEPTPDGQ